MLERYVGLWWSSPYLAAIGTLFLGVVIAIIFNNLAGLVIKQRDRRHRL